MKKRLRYFLFLMTMVFSFMVINVVLATDKNDVTETKHLHCYSVDQGNNLIFYPQDAGNEEHVYKMLNMQWWLISLFGVFIGIYVSMMNRNTKTSVDDRIAIIDEKDRRIEEMGNIAASRYSDMEETIKDIETKRDELIHLTTDAIIKVIEIISSKENIIEERIVNRSENNLDNSSGIIRNSAVEGEQEEEKVGTSKKDTEYNNMFSEDKEDPFLMEGRQELLEKQFDKAIASFNKSIEINPSNIEVYMLRGLSYKMIGAHENAIVDFSKAREKIPHKFVEKYVFIRFHYKREWEKNVE